MIEFGGVTRTLTQWAEKIGVSADTLWKRLYSSKMPLTKALSSENYRTTGWVHGSLSGYSDGCRCTACSQARTDYNVKYWRRRHAKA